MASVVAIVLNIVLSGLRSKKVGGKFQPIYMVRTSNVVLLIICNYLKAALVEGINR